MSKPADVCLLLEGTYPYVSGGVSAWTHDLISKQEHLTFHIVSILPPEGNTEAVYELPKNVIGHTNIFLQKLPEGVVYSREYARSVCGELKEPLTNLTTLAHLGDFEKLISLLRRIETELGQNVLLDGQDTWNLLLEMYQENFTESSFLDFFWSWRAIMGSLYSLIMAPLPEARIYHSLSTGYAGMLAARAKIETGRPVLITEHGIYTNERRIEVASADWLEETDSRTLTIDKTRRNLRDLWIDTFTNYSRVCYEAADRIITLFEGNQEPQLKDGAAPEKMSVIPNGVDFERFSSIAHKQTGHPTIALIGRVVPIKDVKNFIRACTILREYMPDLKAFIIGPTDEDREYFTECLTMIEHAGLNETITFTGKVQVDEYFAQIDVQILSSISEAQPLVILEAGACGIPTVATNVGACREMIMGQPSEEPWLGEGGIVVPLSNPSAIAEAVYALLTNPERRQACGAVMRERVRLSYNKRDQFYAYRDVYNAYLG